MFIMSWITALVTFAIVFSIYTYLQKAGVDINWGSSTQGQVFKNALDSTVKLNLVEEHVKNYRPSVLVLTGNPSSRPPLVDFAYNITKQQGLMVCGHIFVGTMTLSVRQRTIRQNSDWLAKRRIKGIYSLIEADCMASGVHVMLQLVGLGKLKPNILMIGYPRRWHVNTPDEVQEYFDIMQIVFDMNMGFCILRLPDGLDYSQYFESETGIPYRHSVQLTNPLEEDSAVNHVTFGSLESISEAISEESHEEEGEAEDDQEKQARGARGRRGTMVANLHHFRRINSMEAARIHPAEVPPEIVALANQFQMKQKKGTVDVWWLYDDGGLTLLLPYLLTTRNQWNECKLRVFSVAPHDMDLDEAQINMAALLSKFRINTSDVTILPDLQKQPQDTTIKLFKSLITKWMVKPDAPSEVAISKTDLKAHGDKTNRFLRMRELMLQYSKDSTLIVMTLSLPRKKACPAPLFMAWLEVLSRDLPPFLFVRGNQTSVLTFYS